MTTVHKASSQKPVPTKSAAVCKLLARPRGATQTEIMKVTGWQNHSLRAFLSGLRKKGHRLDKSRRNDTTCYHIVAADGA
jgi:hypothetical protein